MQSLLGSLIRIVPRRETSAMLALLCLNKSSGEIEGGARRILDVPRSLARPFFDNLSFVGFAIGDLRLSMFFPDLGEHGKHQKIQPCRNSELDPLVGQRYSIHEKARWTISLRMLRIGCVFALSPLFGDLHIPWL